MSEFSRSDILNLATLSGLDLSDEEVESLSVDIQQIIEYVNKLDELDVSDVEPTYQVTDIVNAGREDIVDEGEASSQQLLDLSGHEYEGQIKVPKVL